MNDERTNGSLRACEADATCHAPAVHRVNVLRPGWRVPESRLYCIMHAAQVPSVEAPATTVTAYDAPVRRPLRAEVLAALRDRPHHLSVIRNALNRPSPFETVRRELEQLIEEGLAVEGPPSHFARRSGATQEPEMKTLTQAERVLEDVRAHPWTSVGDVVRRTRDAKAAARLVEAVQAGRIVRIGEQRSYRYAIPGTPIPGLGAEGGPTMPVEGESADCNAVAPPEVVSASAPAMEESPDFGIADPVPAFGHRPTLRARLLAALGGLGEGAPEGDDALIDAVKELRERNNAIVNEPLGEPVLWRSEAQLIEVGADPDGRRAHAIVLFEGGEAAGTRLRFELTHHDAKLLAPLLFEAAVLVELSGLPTPTPTPTPVLAEPPAAPAVAADMPF